MEQFEYTRALKSLEFAESLGVDDQETHFLKARIYRKTGRFNLFEESLGKAGSKGLPKTRIENEKLLLRGQSGNLRELLDELENLAGGVDQFDPREVYEAIVNGFLLYGRFMDANLYVQNWEKDFPTDPRQRFYRAILLIRFGPIQKIQGAQEKAAGILDKLTSEYPNYFQAAMTYGDLLFNLNRIEDAVPQFERCRQHPDAGIQPTLSLARCYANLGQQQKAKALFREVLEREPANDFARAELGKLQYNDEEFEEARANLEAAQLVLDIVLCRHEDDGNLACGRIGLQPPADLETVHLGHRDVQEHDGRRAGLHDVQRLCASGRDVFDLYHTGGTTDRNASARDG